MYIPAPPDVAEPLPVEATVLLLKIVAFRMGALLSLYIPPPLNASFSRKVTSLSEGALPPMLNMPPPFSVAELPLNNTPFSAGELSAMLPK